MLHTSILYCVLHCLHITQTYQTCTLYITFVNNWWTVCCLLWLVKTLSAALLGLWKTRDWTGKNPKQNWDWLPRVSKTRIRNCYASLLFWVCCCCNNFETAPQWVHFFTFVGCLLEEFILGFLLLMLVRKTINQTQARPRIGLTPKFGKNSNKKKLLCNLGLQLTSGATQKNLKLLLHCLSDEKSQSWSEFPLEKTRSFDSYLYTFLIIFY